MSAALRTAVVGAVFFASCAAQAQWNFPSDQVPFKVGTRVWVAPTTSYVYQKGTVVKDLTSQNAYVVRTDALAGIAESDVTVMWKSVDELTDECKPPHGELRAGVPRC